ncbi:MAG: phosphoglycerate kinase, partial [Candidatus Peribacteraceae bacterium]|nr:phosphoglycerate kinase [Candidatus Peribacteraceae bacterium]
MIDQLSKKTLENVDIKGKKVLLRAGFDLPIVNGVVTDDSRIQAMLPSMNYILENGGSLILLSHQGRPKGEINPEFSQKPLLPVLNKYLNLTVKFAKSCTGETTKD